jgi:beta-lactamase regulating signal transducer with metallopeptidase domain
MIATVLMWLGNAPWMRLLELLIDVTIKGAALCIAAGVAALLLRRSSASTRNMVWVFALIVLILLPVFTLMSPAWHLPIIPKLDSWGRGSYTSAYTKPDPEMFVGPLLPAHAGALETAGAGVVAPHPLPWHAWVFLAWMAGGMLYLGWCLISHAGVRAIVKRARPASRAWNRVLNSSVREIGIGRPVRLLESSRIKAAITVGILEPAVVLPADSEEWPDDRRRLVLSHELAHVKRWDTLVETLALCTTVFYWFNPFVWFAVKQLRIERERDCDNAVLGTGARPSDYAELLMHIAADLGDAARPVWQLSTISQSSNLKDRIMSILNQRINRTRGTRRSAVLTGLIVCAIALPISTSGLWNVQAQEKSKAEKKAQYEQEKRKALEEKAAKEAQMNKQKEEELKAKALKEAEIEKKNKMEKMSAEEKLKAGWEKMCSNDHSAACKVAMVMKKQGTDAGTQAFFKMKKAGDGEYYFDEKEFNTAGYMFLNSKKTAEAIAIFELNVKEYPDSWNVYDSLGEAYMAAERYDDAEANYKTALKMNPEATSAQHALQEIAMKREKSSS